MEWLKKIDDKNEYIVLTPDVVDGSYYSFKEQTKLLGQLNRIEADLFHFTHFNVPVLFRKPYVVTIHDATRFFFPGEKQQGLIKQMAYEFVFQQALKHARRVICVSDATRREVAGLPVGLHRATVIHEGVDDIFFEKPSRDARAKARMLLGTRDPYILYIGVWMSHKNLRRVMEAFAELRKKRPALKLVMTGKPRPGYMNMAKVARQLSIESSVMFPGFVPSGLLPALYAEAAVCIVPSLYEGFGLPALEAAAAECPVVTSNVSAMPEILPEGAELVNPEYVPGIASAIERILTDEAHRARLTRQAQGRAAEFSWEKCARRTLEVYLKACSM